jgi:hybrid cluster-associated redox disulfide protein
MRTPKLNDPDLPLTDLMTLWPETIPVFLRHKMLCVGCMISPFHTVLDACTEYHLDQDAFMAELMAQAVRRPKPG